MSGTEVRTISDVLVEYDELETPQSPAHELWFGVNWLNDQLDIELPDGGLTGKNQEVMVIEEEKQGGYIEIHHTHSEPVPARISSIMEDTYCEITASESRLHSSHNIVHTIIWIVPISLTGTWEQPEPSFDQYESFDQSLSEESVGVGDVGSSTQSSVQDAAFQSSTTPINRHKPNRLRNGLLSCVYAVIIQSCSIFLSRFETSSDEALVSMVDTLQNVMDFMVLLVVFIGIISLFLWIADL